MAGFHIGKVPRNLKEHPYFIYEGPALLRNVQGVLEVGHCSQVKPRIQGSWGSPARCFHLHWDSLGARSLILDFFFPVPTSSHYPIMLPWRTPEVPISLWNRKMPWRRWESAVVKTSEKRGQNEVKLRFPVRNWLPASQSWRISLR